VYYDVECEESEEDELMNSLNGSKLGKNKYNTM
jgi:hypothetical protein